MRRLASILAMMAMLMSLFSPLLAQAQGADVSHPMVCHRAAGQTAHTAAKHHHCAMTAESAPEPSSGEPSIKAGKDLPQCPMDCCMQSHPQNGTALSSNPKVPPLAVTETVRQVASVTFVSAGFSSHTDRGPPAA
ncbi:MAG TPA: hypothetical protein VJN64_06330 [Terriglobales bacterium]|nr:hypothetical protein [Terriglobales bacterium]